MARFRVDIKWLVVRFPERQKFPGTRLKVTSKNSKNIHKHTKKHQKI